MKAPAAIGVALGNLPLQDQLFEVLTLEAGLDVRACRTDAELEMLLAGRVLGGVVLGPRLVGLEQRVLPAVSRSGVRAVLVVPPASVELQRARLADSVPNLMVLPDTVSIAAIRAALAGGSTSDAGGRATHVHAPDSPAAPRRRGRARGGVHPRRGRMVVVTGCGGPGCSTVVGNVTYLAGATQAAAAVDLDLVRPSLVPMLDGDPSLGLAGIIRAQKSGVTLLEQALDEHLQPLGDPRYSPHACLLGGLPLDGSNHILTADLAVRLLEALRQRAALVVVDVGQVLAATEQVGAVQRAVLMAADGILVVSGCDRLSVKRTQDYVARLVAGEPHPDPAHLALVLNRHERRLMEAPDEIASLVGLPLAACVPVDRGALAASGTGVPLAARGSAAAARSLMQLADALSSSSWPPAPYVTPTVGRRFVTEFVRRLRTTAGAARARVEVGHSWPVRVVSRPRAASASPSTEPVQP